MYYVIYGKCDYDSDSCPLGITDNKNDAIMAESYFEGQGYYDVEYEEFDDFMKCKAMPPPFYTLYFTIELKPYDIGSYRMKDVGGIPCITYCQLKEDFRWTLDYTLTDAGNQEIKIKGYLCMTDKIPGTKLQEDTGKIVYTDILTFKKWLRDKINESGQIRLLIPHVDYDPAELACGFDV